jgi:hypothetical protein
MSTRPVLSRMCGDDLAEYANEMRDLLLDADLRVDVDASDNRLPAAGCRPR